MGGGMGNGMRIAAIAGIGCVVALATLGGAAAQVRYARPPVDAPIDFFSPYDESYGTSPSYQVFPYAYGGPAVRVIERCQYPDGWNVTDFGRDINGIPNGIEHTCRPSRIGGRLRARY